jgi:hypothetical protein
MAQNIDYRSIFLLLALPGVFALQRAGVAKAGWLAIAIVALLWESFFRIAAVSVMPVLAGQAVGYSVVIMVWAGREVLWWWVITQFLALLFLYAGAALSRALACLPHDPTTLPCRSVLQRGRGDPVLRRFHPPGA